MARGAKFVETRHWNTKVRGEVWIHAAKTKAGISELLEDPMIARMMAAKLGVDVMDWERELPFGALIGKGVLQVAMPAANCRALYPAQIPFGNFADGRFGHIYKGLEAIEPIPLRGQQGFFYAEVAA